MPTAGHEDRRVAARSGALRIVAGAGAVLAAAVCALIATSAPGDTAGAGAAAASLRSPHLAVVTTHPISVPAPSTLIDVAMTDQRFFEKVAVIDHRRARATGPAAAPVTKAATTGGAPAVSTTTSTTSVAATDALDGVPAEGDATAWGCSAALAYLRAYAAPGFALECPGPAQGHEATTCDGNPVLCPGTPYIGIADPCPQAYMNEAHNSWLMSEGAGPDADWDPYGACPT